MNVLGVIFDSKLTWNMHVSYCINKSKKSLFALRLLKRYLNKNEMRMLFEVQDLSVASPATVSRCGMVYIDEAVVGYKPIVSNYYQENLIKLIPKKED